MLSSGPHLGGPRPCLPGSGPRLPSPPPCVISPGLCLLSPGNLRSSPRPCLPSPEPRLPILRPCLPNPEPLLASPGHLLPSPRSCVCPPVSSPAEVLSSLLPICPSKSQSSPCKRQAGKLDLREQKVLRVSRAETVGAELPKVCRGTPAVVRQSPQELSPIEREHIEVSEESLHLVLPPPKPPSPAHLVVESLEEERATQQLRLRLAKCPSCPAPLSSKDRLSLPCLVRRSKGRTRLRGPRKGRMGSADPQATWSTRSSRTDCTEPETLKTTRRSPNQSSAARLPLLDPAFTGHHHQELPCLSEVRPEIPTFVEPPPRPRRLAHTIVQSLDKERAMQDLQLSLAKGLEKGHGLQPVEYPVCLLCGQCNPPCQHPRTQHDPCLQVYPRMTVQNGEVRMKLGFHLKMKGPEAEGSGLGPGKEASQVPPGKEQPPMLKRDGWRSRAPENDTTKRQAHSPERRPGPARGHPVTKPNPRPGGPKAAPKTWRFNFTSASKSSTKPSKAVPAGEGPHQPKAPRKHLCFLKRLVLKIKRVWEKLQKKKTSLQQDSGASPQKLGSSFRDRKPTYKKTFVP